MHRPALPASTSATGFSSSQSPSGEKQLARLIEQFPSSPFAADAQMKIARRAYAEKRWTDAADGFRRVVSQFPGFSAADQAQFLLADSYSQAKMKDEARQAYEQAGIGPGDVDVAQLQDTESGAAIMHLA